MIKISQPHASQADAAKTQFNIAWYSLYHNSDYDRTPDRRALEIYCEDFGEI